MARVKLMAFTELESLYHQLAGLQSSYVQILRAGGLVNLLAPEFYI